jgi:threonine aldolase
MSNEINMYSDTVTRPSPEMLQAMVTAEVGDDMSGLDPTVNALEAMVAEMLDKEAAVFACSGTQSNQMGVRSHCGAGDELLIEEHGHIANFEAGAPAILGGVSCRTILGKHGFLDVEQLEGKIRADNQHLCITKLLCLENTANGGGGRVWPIEQLHRVCNWAHDNGLKTHLDGARLFNAVTSSGSTAREICTGFDTISICFSKGLGCPMGSIMVGSQEEVTKARRTRKIMGGALRQAGVVAAAAIYALENNIDRLAEDHSNAKTFASAVEQIDGVKIDIDEVESNLVFFGIDRELGNACQLSAALKEHGVMIGAMGPQTMRACTHLDVTTEQVVLAAQAVQDRITAGFKQFSGSPYGPFARA